MGDCNSIPSNTKKIIEKPILLLTDYPTHINPNRKVSYYDQTYIVGLPTAKLLPANELSIYSQALIRSINRGRYKYLSQQEILID